MAFLITLAFIALILLCGFMVLVILMQKASEGAGLGGAIGGGAAESAFGGEASNVLTKVTIYCAVIFFVGSLGLSLIILSHHDNPARPELLDQIDKQIESTKKEETPAIQPAGESVKGAEEALESAVKTTEEAVESATEATSAAVDEVQKGAETAVEEGKKAVEQAREGVEEAVEKAKSSVEKAEAAVKEEGESLVEEKSVPEGKNP